MTIFNKFLWKRFSNLLASALILPAIAQADHVKLYSIDGSVEIVGELVGVENNAYVIVTALGKLTVPIDSVTCEGAECPSVNVGAVTNITGSDSIGFGLMPSLFSGFAAHNDAEMTSKGEGASAQYSLMNRDHNSQVHLHSTFNVQPTVSGDGFTGLLDKTAEISMSTRRISEAEHQQLRANGAGNMTSADQERVIGIGGLVIITHPDVGITLIGAKQIGKMYSGQITNWKQIGGPDLPVVLYGRQGNSGPGAVFDHMFFKNLGFSRTDNIQILDSNAAMTSTVNTQPGAIGFVEHASSVDANALAFKSKCGIVFRPTSFALKTEEYPLLSRLYLYNRGDNTSEGTQAFLDYAISSDADDVVSDAGFIGLGIMRARQNSMEGRLGNLMSAELQAGEQTLGDRLAVELLQYDRLSTTVRFASGSSQVSNKAMVDLDRLVEYLEDIEENVEISLVGFTDTDGGFAMNTRLSNRRSEQVAAAFLRAGAGRLGENVSIATRGYSELSPAVCNLSAKAKGINRRVEFWIREVN